MWTACKIYLLVVEYFYQSTTPILPSILYRYSPTRLLDEVPKMFAFPKLRDIFSTIAKKIPATVYTNAHVESISRHKKGKRSVITIHSDCFKNKDSNDDGTAEFDEVVLCCGAEEALRMLGTNATFMERKFLQNVSYYNDLIVTHEDEEYMKQFYEFHPQEDMYFVRCDPEEPKRIEMSFNLTAYQPHLQGKRTIYQSIFLDDSQRQFWTDNEINPDKILKKRMTRQFAHTWTHFAFWVPFVRFLQGKKHTWYAGSYTLFNTHEIAVMSGLAAAERLGAKYPFGHDKLATQQFDTYLKLAHGMFVRRRK